MQFDGTRSLQGDRRQVWRALNDPTVLQACVPGCETFTAKDDGTYELVIVAVVGPVKSRMSGILGLKDVVMNESYTLEFEFQGGMAGFGKGALYVTLDDEPGGCLLRYSAETKVGGRIAQLGSRLIEGAAKKLSDMFFERFAQAVSP